MKNAYPNIPQKIRAYHSHLAGNPHHRYRSWEHCYGFFRRIGPGGIVANRNEAAVQLGFHLASWVCIVVPASCFSILIQFILDVVDSLTAPSFAPLWDDDFGSRPNDSKLVPTVFAAIDAIKTSYEQVGQPSDTLVTKIMLGTFGCLPACDRYFIDGFKSTRLKYSYLNPQFVERVLNFCGDNLPALRNEQTRTKSMSRMRYPLMKLVDMYFWQIGSERGKQTAAATS